MKSGTISALACPCTPSSATSGLQRETGQSFSRKSNYKSLASAELVLLRTWKFSRVYTNSKRVQGTLRGGGEGGTAQQAAAMHRSDAAMPPRRSLLTCLVATIYVRTYVRICMWQSECRRLYVRVAYSRGHTLVAFVYVVIVGLEKRRESQALLMYVGCCFCSRY